MKSNILITSEFVIFTKHFSNGICRYFHYQALLKIPHS